MMIERTSLERRILGALDASPSRIPVVLGACGSGRTQLLSRVHDHLGRDGQFIDVERTATTPERFFDAVMAASPFPHTTAPQAATTRDAFVGVLTHFDTARSAAGRPVTFLLDEVLELRTFESFPGLRHTLRELLDRLATSENRFVLTSRYVARAHRLLRDATARFEVIHVPELTVGEVQDYLGALELPVAEHDQERHARSVHALAVGRPSYVTALAEGLASMYDERAAADPISALAALLAPENKLASICRFSYELRLHRARGYGALKAILEILAEQEPLTLTEIALRLRRTPGSTKDYLSWLEDVDLVTVTRKKYSFADPLLRLWVRLFCRPLAPTVEDIAGQVRRYAVDRLPEPEPELASDELQAPSGSGPTKSWGIIEID